MVCRSETGARIGNEISSSTPRSTSVYLRLIGCDLLSLGGRTSNGTFIIYNMKNDVYVAGLHDHASHVIFLFLPSLSTLCPLTSSFQSFELLIFLAFVPVTSNSRHVTTSSSQPCFHLRSCVSFPVPPSPLRLSFSFPFYFFTPFVGNTSAAMNSNSKTNKFCIPSRRIAMT